MKLIFKRISADIENGRRLAFGIYVITLLLNSCHGIPTNNKTESEYFTVTSTENAMTAATIEVSSNESTTNWGNVQGTFPPQLLQSPEIYNNIPGGNLVADNISIAESANELNLGSSSTSSRPIYDNDELESKPDETSMSGMTELPTSTETETSSGILEDIEFVADLASTFFDVDTRWVKETVVTIRNWLQAPSFTSFLIIPALLFLPILFVPMLLIFFPIVLMSPIVVPLVLIYWIWSSSSSGSSTARPPQTTTTELPFKTPQTMLQGKMDELVTRVIPSLASRRWKVAEQFFRKL